jgi:hypothetical protein
VLPSSRNRDYDTGVPVHPGDLNDLQDAVVDGKHGELELVLPGLWKSNGSTTLTYFTGPIRTEVTSNGAVFLEIPTIVGQRITSVQFSMRGDGAADVVAAEVWKTTAAGASASIGSHAAINNEPAAWSTKTIDVTDTTLLTGESLCVQVAMNATGIALGNLRVFYSKP